MIPDPGMAQTPAHMLHDLLGLLSSLLFPLSARLENQPSNLNAKPRPRSYNKGPPPSRPLPQLFFFPLPLLLRPSTLLGVFTDNPFEPAEETVRFQDGCTRQSTWSYGHWHHPLRLLFRHHGRSVLQLSPTIPQ